MNRNANTGLLFWIIVSMVCAVGQNRNAFGQQLPLSEIAELMATPRNLAAQGIPMRIRGIVSSTGEGIATLDGEVRAATHFCVEDATAGIWVRSFYAVLQGMLEDGESSLAGLDCGVEIEMEGILDKGGFAPVILPTRIVVLGNKSLTEAPRADVGHFLSGGYQNQRIKVTGVVQSISNESQGQWLARVETGVGHFLTRLPKQARYQPDLLLDAEVEVTGLAAASRNWRSEFVCPRLIVNRHEDFRILKSAPASPFEVETVSIIDLDGFSPNGRPLHRRCIEGTVTYYDGAKLLYVQNNQTGIRVELSDSQSVSVGDRVDVSGFIDTSRYLAGLRGALVRRSAVGERLAPIKTTLRQIIERYQNAKKDNVLSMNGSDGQLIQLDGRLLSFQAGTAPNPHRLEIDCGDSVTTALLARGGTRLPPGTSLKVTGIAQLTFSAPDQSANLALPTRVDLLLRDGNDIVVVERPSWWTAGRTFTALLIVAGFALSAFAWAFILRQSLTRQTNLLALEMKGRHDAAIEFQAAIRERTRLAANLHDTLLQTMAGIGFQIEACGQSDLSGADKINGHLETASRMIQHGQDDLRNTVWALHCLPLDEGTFLDSVQRVTQKIASRYATEISVGCVDNFPILADFIAGNLLLVIQEAIHNAIKHAKAGSIIVELDATPNGEFVHISVRDDGQGFDVNSRRTSIDGHFGLEGIEQRIERLGGTFTIKSKSGFGTTIIAHVPLRNFDPKIA